MQSLSKPDGSREGLAWLGDKKRLTTCGIITAKNEHCCTHSYLSQLQCRVIGSCSSATLALDGHFTGNSRSWIHY